MLSSTLLYWSTALYYVYNMLNDTIVNHYYNYTIII